MPHKKLTKDFLELYGMPRPKKCLQGKGLSKDKILHSHEFSRYSVIVKIINIRLFKGQISHKIEKYTFFLVFFHHFDGSTLLRAGVIFRCVLSS